MARIVFGLSGSADRLSLSAEIDATDREIDCLVYDVYGVTEEEGVP